VATDINRNFDKHLGAAILAAPLFWLVLSFFAAPANNWLHPLSAPVLFLARAVVYPILEEMIFRGGIQGIFLTSGVGRLRWCGVSAANLITSLLFAAMHLLSHPAYWAAAAGVPSLIFGHFRERTNSLRVPIVLHVFYNTGYFWIFVES
jgi:uncharacterized protein